MKEVAREGRVENGSVVVQELDVQAVEATEFYCQCNVHPTTMIGTLRVVEQRDACFFGRLYAMHYGRTAP